MACQLQEYYNLRVAVPLYIRVACQLQEYYNLRVAVPLYIAVFKRLWLSSSKMQNFLIWREVICALQKTLSPLNLSLCRVLEVSTLFLMVSKLSPVASADNCWYFTAGTSICISILSRSGPEIFFKYLCISCMLHFHPFLPPP